MAIVAGYLGVRSSNRSQLMLTREEYLRDRLTETYLGLLQGVHLRGAQLEEARDVPLDQPLRTPMKADFDPTADREVMSAARLLAYASPEVEELWRAFTIETHAFDGTLHMLRQVLGKPPGEIRDPVVEQQIAGHYQRWIQARSDLQERIRAELWRPDLADKGKTRWISRAWHKVTRRSSVAALGDG